MKTNDRSDHLSRLRTLCCAGLLVLLAACQTVPPEAPPPAAAVRVKTLRALGFVHTDSYGSRDYNVERSRRRAEAVARELAAHGFAEGAIVRQAWGFEYPAAPNETPDGRALNRRVTIVTLRE